MQFAHRLALAMGEVNVEEMLAKISYRQFLRWMAFNRLSPFGDERADLRSAIVACTVANARPRKRGSRSFKPADFMPFRKKRSGKDSWNLLKSFFGITKKTDDTGTDK